MRKSTTFVLGACFAIVLSSPTLLGQGRQRQTPVNPGLTRPPVTRDQREDRRDRREDVRDRRENIRDRREDVLDRRRDGGIRDRREDRLDRREDIRDRREDVRDRLEDRIDRNPRFASGLRDLLPPGASARDAISGFENEGQFLAALHASQNLNISFDRLKAEVTGNNAVSLGQAIHGLRPDLSDGAVRDALLKAEQQGRDTGAAD
jgi:hypothetical protein